MRFFTNVSNRGLGGGTWVSLLLCGGVVLAACASSVVPTYGGPSGSTAGGGSGAASGGGSGSSGSGGGGPALLPVRIRRLTDAEWRASAKALLGVDSTAATSFTPDARQTGFTRSDAQLVDPVLAGQIDDAAHELATAATTLSGTAPCSNSASGGEACAKAFIADLTPRAYRRPATQGETDGLLAVYHAAADGGVYADGIQAVIAAVLESPGFIYVTEMGSGSGDVVTLTDFEIASALSFLLTGQPPDGALTAAAQAGQLADPAVRQQQARRLLKTSDAKTQLTAIIEQWLGIDAIADLAKDTTVYGQFAGLRNSMKAEADAFVSEIVWNEGKGVAELFGATWTMADSNLAQFYKAGAPDGSGRVSLAGTGRVGILDQAAFLSVYAHASESGPVLRGVAVLRRVVCDDIPPPSSLNIVVVPPPPDPTKTTRQRYAVHATDAVCAGCHSAIDAFGFAFENFDGQGLLRTSDATPAQPVDSTTVVPSIGGLGGSYPDSAALATAIAGSATVRQCFATKMFQYAAAHPFDSATSAARDSFVTTWSALPAEAQGSLTEVLVAYAGSAAFISRKVVQ